MTFTNGVLNSSLGYIQVSGKQSLDVTATANGNIQIRLDKDRGRKL